MKLIDTHSHMYSDKFNEDLELAVKRAKEVHVSKIYMPNIDLESIEPMKKLASDFPGFFVPMMGLHPCSVGADVEEVLSKIKSELDLGGYVAVGEIGIDLYWDKTFFKEQEHAFRTQISWAKEKQLPIVIHARDSFDEIFSIVDEMNDDRLTGIFHCFTGDIDQAHKIINYGGFKMGVGGVLTFKNSGLDAVVKEIDLKHFVLETDSPYLSPMPHRGKRNESAYVSLVAQKLADIHELPIERVAEITTNNALEVYKEIN
ncbi:MAG: TatD DNase family protein [Patiriisocius sp.]|jgi:TatD DNase family protein